MKKTISYMYLRAWDFVIYRDEFLRQTHINKAVSDNAPEDAVFFSTKENRWIHFSEISNKIMLREMNKIMKNPNRLLLSSEIE